MQQLSPAWTASVPTASTDHRASAAQLQQWLLAASPPKGAAMTKILLYTSIRPIRLVAVAAVP